MSAQKTEQSVTKRNESLGLNDFDSLKKSKRLSPEAFALAVRTLLHNWRQGTVACLDRGDVSGSNKKPWRQKGTGRARAGTVKSPLWRGGGVIFGPQKRTRTLTTPRKVRQAVVRDLLQDVLENKRLLVVDWALQGDKPNTKQAFAMLKAADVAHTQTNVFLTPNDLRTAASFANIPSAVIS